MNKSFANYILDFLEWIEGIVVHYLMVKFSVKFLKLVFSENYQGAKQLGEDVKNQYGTDDVVYETAKEFCSYILEVHRDEISDSAKVVAIKVLAGLKST
jgi:hypothetical protein